MLRLIALVLLLEAATVLAGQTSQPVIDLPSYCKSFLMMVEQDGATSDLAMTGLTDHQIDWIRKNQNKEEFQGICPFPFDPNNKRVPATLVKDPDQAHLGTRPLYVVRWKQERTFVPDNDNGHFAIAASGILYRMDMSGEGKLIPIGPVHDTNRTILSDSTVSLLKYVLNQIKGQ
jgi:hypothetical protein